MTFNPNSLPSSQWRFSKPNALPSCTTNQDYDKGVAEDAKRFLQPYIDFGQVKLVYYDTITPHERDYTAVVSQIKQINPDVMSSFVVAVSTG